MDNTRATQMELTKEEIEGISQRIGNAVAIEVARELTKFTYVKNSKIDLAGKYSVFDTPIKATKLSNKAKTVLTDSYYNAEPIRTIGDLLRYGKSGLLQRRNLGKKTLEEIENYLKSLGLELGMLQV